MSVTYEKNARSMFEAESRDEIKEALFLIFKYTFVFEFIGFIILSLRFSYLNVIDSWIDPQNGGVFKRKDWENIVAKAYQIDKNAKINIFTNDSIVKSLKEEDKRHR